jgi:hypothetical protein
VAHLLLVTLEQYRQVEGRLPVQGAELLEVAQIAAYRLHQGQVMTLRYEHREATQPR